MIKNCNKNNIQNISKLILDAIEDIASTLTGEFEEEKILETLDSYIKMDICRLSHKNIFTYVKDEKIVGILVAYSSNDIDILDKPMLLNLKDKGILKDSFEKECFEDEFYIDTISVLKKYQGQGIAKEFFNLAGVNMGNVYDNLNPGIYICKTTYENGQIESSKVFKQKQ